MKKKVFVSYDHSEDLMYKNLLRAWDNNDAFDFEFDQRSPNEPIDSNDAAVIKRALATKIKESQYLLVIVGEKSSKSKWMRWEIDRAMQSDAKLKLAAVKIKDANTLPEGLTTSNTSVAKSFTQDEIIKAINLASNAY